MLLLDTTIVNVAQQVIKQDLDASLPQIQWILDSYILAYAVLLLSFGRLGDVFGRKKMFIFGMAIFIGASVLCGLSTAIGHLLGISASTALIVSRVLQGVGGALMMPQTLSLITVVFPPEQRGAAMGAWGSVVSLGAILGPIIGGIIVSNFAWQWIFLINIPIGIAAIIATVAIVPESVDPLASRKIDWGGVLLSGAGIFAFVYAAIEGNHRGWTDPLILGLIVLSILLLTAFVAWEKRAADPMMKLELFDIRNFSAGNVIGLLVSFGMLGIFFPMTLFLQGRARPLPDRRGPHHDPHVADHDVCCPRLRQTQRPTRRALDSHHRARADDRRHSLPLGPHHPHDRLEGSPARPPPPRRGDGHDVRSDDRRHHGAGPAADRGVRLRHPQHQPQHRAGARHRHSRLGPPDPARRSRQ
jgi:MFS family permease